MSAIKQEFVVTGDEKAAAAYRKLALENENLRRQNEKLAAETERAG